MKSYRSSIGAAAAVAALLAGAFAAHGALDPWVENLEAGNKLEAVFFKAFPLLTGTVAARRPPQETRAELSKLIADSPGQADLYSLRALEAEQQLDYTAAEADWKKYVELSKDKAGANQSLADYYDRRLMSKEEISALRAVAAAPSSPEDQQLPDSSQKAWLAFTRIIAIAHDQMLGGDLAVETYRAWVERYPKNPESYRTACLALIPMKQFAAAESVLASYEKLFPDSGVFAVQARAGLELAKGNADRALGVFEAAYQPDWSDEMAQQHYAFLQQEGRVKQYSEQVRAQANANPVDLNAATRLYFLSRVQSNVAGSARALTAFRKRKEERQSAWTPREHEVLAQLFERANQYDDAARHYHALYVHPNSTAAQTEAGLGGVVNLLLTAPDQAMEIGAGDLSYYKDIATADRSTGYLNAVLSLLLNSQAPSGQYYTQDGQSIAYFHRVKAAQLSALFDQKYPKSARRAAFRAKLVQVYSTYGDTKAVSDFGHRFLTQFPEASERTEIALLTADAHTRLNQPDQEFAIYRQLLVELAKKAGGKPIGVVTGLGSNQAAGAESSDQDPNNSDPQMQASRGQEAGQNRGLEMIQKANAGAKGKKAAAEVKSPDYVRVLERYLARLVAMERVPEALRVYRGEIGRNPNDPGLYERFAAFLDQNKLGADIERVYRDAMQKFPEDKGWTDRLARWYLREKMRTKFAELTRQVTGIFSGTDLEAYFSNNVPAGGSGLSEQLYLQLNQYAHQRFPHNQTFVRNLLTAYTWKPTANPAAYEQLLRENWHHSPELRSRFFELLSRTRRLDGELAALRASKPKAETNPVAARMLAEAEVWKTNYESAAQPLRTVSAVYPADAVLGGRAASLHRSLDRVDAAIQIESTLAKAFPRSTEHLTTMGEIQADRERYDLAAPYWVKMVSIEPGRPEGYLESATVFWDYFQFADAHRMIDLGRQKTGDATLYSYEKAVIFENQRDYQKAIGEYAKGAVAEGGTGRSSQRLIQLGRRTALRGEVEAVTARLGNEMKRGNLSLRIAVLEAQERKQDLERYLGTVLGATSSPDLMAVVESSASQNGFTAVSLRVLERRVELASADPMEKLRARIAVARFHENHNNKARASEILEALLQENPATLGIIRTAVSYYWSNRNQARAIDILTSAADRAEQPYQDRFRFEAAQKSTEAGQFDRAQQLLARLLDKEPYRADYLAASGDLYAKRGDNAGLRTYYTNTIESLKKSPLAVEEKVNRIAALRRSLIPVLANLKDYTGAVDQYIEIINRYPEDGELVKEAALFAIENGQRERLTAFYAKTAATSSRDVRWPVVLSQIETQAEQYERALEWLDKARAIRPERVDLLQAKGPLEERLFRFENAAKTYTTLWELTYHSPQWMVKVAEQSKRLGRDREAIAALERAFITDLPERASGYQSAAQAAAQWGLLREAKTYVAKGIALDGKNKELRAMLGELSARLHETAQLPVAGSEATVDTRWGSAIATYSTPEEKAALAGRLDPGLHRTYAEAAGMVEVVTNWQKRVADENGTAAQRLASLLHMRGLFEEIGPRLEAASNNGTLSIQSRDTLLAQAREAYAAIGDRQNELRILDLERAAGRNTALSRDQYAALAAANPQLALSVVSSDRDAELRTAVANRVLARGDAAQSMAIIAAYGKSFTPVWTRAYTAQAGIYFGLHTPQVDRAFREVLGPRVIGQQLSNKPDNNEQVTGVNWNYYAARFGEFLDAAKAGDAEAEDFLLTRLEATPDSAAAYAALSNYYAERGNYDRALGELDYVLQLNPAAAEPHIRKAEILARQGKSQAAIGEWKTALAALEKELNTKPASTWWDDLATVLRDTAEFKVWAALRADLTRVVALHFERNGTYNAESLLEPIFRAPGNEKAGLEWLLELVTPNRYAEELVGRVRKAEWLPESALDGMMAREIALAEAHANRETGYQHASLVANVQHLKAERISALLRAGNTALADRLYNEIPAEYLKTEATDMAPMELRVHLKRGTLDQLFAAYERNGVFSPAMDKLVEAASAIGEEGDKKGAHQILAFVYKRELAKRNFTGPVFLGLASLRLEENDLEGALAQLRRLNLLVGEPFAWYRDSAELLERTGHSKEALAYYDLLIKTAPWSLDARLSGALLRGKIDELVSLAAEPLLPYRDRVVAALAARKLGGASNPQCGSAELNLLAGKDAVTEARASQPYYVAARLLGAEQARDAETRYRLLRGALATAPGEGDIRLRAQLAAVDAGHYWIANLLHVEGRDGAGMEAADRVRYLRAVIETKRRLGEWVNVTAYQAKLRPLLSGAERKTLDDAAEAARRQAEIAAWNEAHRPVISDKLLPDRIIEARVDPNTAKGANQ